MSATKDPVPVANGEPKRVILRLRYNQFTDDDNSHMEAIKAYFTAIGRELDEFEQGRHVLHVEMRQDYMESNPKASFHMTLDMEKDAIQQPNMDKLTHELYSVRRQNDGLAISRLSDTWLSLARQLTDKRYVWGVSPP